MSEFIMDTSGTIYPAPGTEVEGRTPGAVIKWDHLDAFTQGYLEAAFFTENDPQHDKEDFINVMMTELEYERVGSRTSTRDNWEGSIPWDASFGDLSPETFAAAILDCAAFQYMSAWLNAHLSEDEGMPSPRDMAEREKLGGRDFWYTRNGHGCGFWDGDWAEPHGTALTEAAKAFPEVDVYWGDDGRVHHH